MLPYYELARESEFVGPPVWVLSHNRQIVSLRRLEVACRLRHLLRTEQVWEPLFATGTFVLTGWYLFWLYRALQGLAFVSGF